MLRKTLVAGLAVLAVVAVGSAAPQRADPKATEDADFTGKVLSVQVTEPARGAVLQNARLKRLGGRMFLVGESPRTDPDEDAPEAVYWFPVENIQLIREYKTLEDMKKDFELSAKQWKAFKEKDGK